MPGPQGGPRDRISVALCTCNGSRYIDEQITSICAQSLPPLQIVLRDDRSDDDTVERARRAWARCREQAPGRTPTLDLAVNERRLGVAANFASALAACTGEVVALCDQDDRWHPERLERQMARMQSASTPLLLHGDARLVDADGRPQGRTLFQALHVSRAELQALRQGRAFGALLNRNLVTGATTLIRRELLAQALPIPPHWLHDEWLAILAAAQGRMAVETELLLDYRQHGRNQVGADRQTLGAVLSKAGADRVGWHTWRLRRAQELEARLQALPVPAAVRAAASEKVAHHHARAGYPASRARRPSAVLREWRTGRYALYGRGFAGVLKDLLERP